MKYEAESRPWGMYEVLLDSDECKVKTNYSSSRFKIIIPISL